MTARLDAVTEIRSWCRDTHATSPAPDECLFCYAADIIDRHRTEIHDLARLATQGKQRDVEMYINRLAHRHRDNRLGNDLQSLIVWASGPMLRVDDEAAT